MASEDDDATIHMLVHGGTENRTDEDVDAKAALAGVKNESKNVGAWDSFFHFYGLIVHQQNMLHDQVRTGTYKAACMENKVDFKGKVVVDVGTGTGILALFAAQAGAKKVYAIEASNIAENARALVKANGYEDVITVIKGKVEDVTLPEKVDLIISEPMGFLLVHERMLEVMLLAREKWLKPKEEGGKIFPTTGTIYACPFTDQALYDERCAETAFWDQPDFFGINLTAAKARSIDETFGQPIVGYFQPAQLVSLDRAKHVLDFSTLSSKDGVAYLEIPLHFEITATSLLHGIACWFDVNFIGTTQNVCLSTSPFSHDTHWYQCRLLFKTPIGVNEGQTVSGVMKLTANEHSSYFVDMTMAIDGCEKTTTRTNRVNLHQQLYHYMQNFQSAHGQGRGDEHASKKAFD